MPHLTFEEQEKIIAAAKADFWESVRSTLKNMGHTISEYHVPKDYDELFDRVARQAIEDFIYHAVEGGHEIGTLTYDPN